MSGVPPDEYVDEDITEPADPVAYDASVQTNLLLEEIASKLDEILAALINGGVPSTMLTGTIPMSPPPLAPAAVDWQLQQPPALGAVQQGVPLGPQIVAGEPSPGWVCPVHGQRKIVPAGHSQRTGRDYPAFAACPVQDCRQKPPRGT